MSFDFNPAPVEETKEGEATDANTQPAGDTDVTLPVVEGEAGAITSEDAGGEPSAEGEPKPEGEQANTETPPEATETVEGEYISALEGEFFWGEDAVTIDVPQDVHDALKEKGLDARKIAAELYSKGANLTLSEETRKSLDDAFGKFAVDAYLNGLKATNEAYMNSVVTQQKEAEAADTQRFTDVAKDCGGEDGWSRLEGWALDALSDDELAAFNAVMASGNQYLQQYAVRELEGRRSAAQGDSKPDLIEATGASNSGKENAPLSAQDYIKAISQLRQTFGRDTKGAAEAEARLDARRRAGMAQGL